jgi:membrane protein implicated in regulation of membrane protease activity
MRQSILTLAAAASLLAMFTVSAFAAGADKKTIEQVYQQKDQLAGKTVQVSGKVVKVNNGIMHRNFLHIVDGSGKPGSDDLTITSNNTAAIGDQVTVSGTVKLNVDFGMGYSYPLLLEKAVITKQ